MMSASMTRVNSRTIYAPDQPPLFLARWASRIALFCAVVLPIAIVMHRFVGLSTPIALNIAAACFAGAALVLAMAFVAGLDIWVTGRQGAARIVVATVVACALLTIPAGLFIVSRKYPVLNDVTTDVTDPPPLSGAVKLRNPGANPVTYPAGKFATLQQTSYPDIKTLVVPRPAEEAFEIVMQAIGKLKMRVGYDQPPQDDTPGLVEVTDKTMVFGFVDDVVIRIASSSDDEAHALIDVRSSSRYGTSDFGRNAQRVRAILREISGRLEASVPNPDAALRAQRKKDAKAASKMSKDGTPGATGRRSKQDPVRSGTRREPARKASPQE
jgi:Protein of unknown function (DUF1499)